MKMDGKGDTISRKALLAAYDAAHKGPPVWARKLIAEAPAIDAVPVIRCKDCIYWHGTNDGCGCLGFYPRPDWYCADGERKDEATPGDGCGPDYCEIGGDEA